MNMKRFFLGFIMMIALAMVGCNGNGGVPAAGKIQDDPTPVTQNPIDLGMLLAGYTDLGEDKEYTIKAGMSMDVGDAKFMCAAGGADCTVTVKDDKATYSSDGGMVTATGPSQMAQDAYDSTMARIMSIGDHHIKNVPPGNAEMLPALPKHPDAQSTDTTTISLLKGDLITGGVITVTELHSGGTSRTDALGIDDDGTNTYIDNTDSTVTTQSLPNADEFMMQSNPTNPPIAITDWKANVYKRTKPATDTLTIYQNDVAGDEAFNTYYAASNVLIDAVAEDVVTFANASVNKDSTSYFVGAGFPTADGGVIDTSHETGKNEFEGTFHGVAGTYSCGNASTSCRALRADGVLELTGTWKFEPDDPETKVKGVVADGDYLAFGYWKRESKGTNGMTTYNISAFGQGSMPFVASAIPALQGTAKYAGPAAGLFAKRTFSSDGTSQVTQGGEFTADVNLTASFGGGAIAFNDQFSIDGTVTGFKNSKGNTIDPGWALTLNKANFATVNSAGTDYEAHTNSFDGTIKAMGTTVGGKWEGMFYGPSANDAMPSSVAGQFGARFTNGEVLGGFGAVKK